LISDIDAVSTALCHTFALFRGEHGRLKPPTTSASEQMFSLTPNRARRQSETSNKGNSSTSPACGENNEGSCAAADLWRTCCASSSAFPVNPHMLQLQPSSETQVRAPDDGSRLLKDAIFRCFKAASIYRSERINPQMFVIRSFRGAASTRDFVQAM
jgi:hypothetical protein